MPRARLSKDGIEIAKPGFDVDTASLEEMAFSSSMVAMRVALTGIINVSEYSGYMDVTYRRGTVSFPTAFPSPPLVLVAGIIDADSSDQTAVTLTGASDEGGVGWSLPIYDVQVTKTGFELYVHKMESLGPHATTWRYWVFHNTLED